VKRPLYLIIYCSRHIYIKFEEIVLIGVLLTCIEQYIRLMNITFQDERYKHFVEIFIFLLTNRRNSAIFK
jgi:hypothetical protein